MKRLMISLLPLAGLAGTVQVPGEWTSLRPRADAVAAAVPAPVPREHSGQASTLAGASVRVADGAAVAELPDATGLRIGSGGVSLDYPEAKESGALAELRSALVAVARMRV